MKLHYPESLDVSDEITLRRLRPDDAADVLDYSSDPEFCRHLAAEPQRNLADALRFIEQINADVDAGKRLYWGVEYRSKISGTIGFLNLDLAAETLEFGFGIARPLWGEGVVNQCMSALIALATDDYQAKRLRIYTAASNQRAIGFALKHGFAETGRRDGKVYFAVDCGAASNHEAGSSRS